MKRGKKFVSIICIFGMLVTVSLGAGCATQAQTGAATGAGAGALIGGLANMHGSWGATALIGAGVGAGIGYLIGNEEDKKDAARRQQATEGELRPLAGTTWQVVSIVPTPAKSHKSIVSHFRKDGTVVTTKTNLDGKVETTTERYRIVGSTLILSTKDYVVNATFKIDGKKLIIDYGNGSSVLQRVS
ncbi:MAG TPA: glycine zipper domain-containing protein [Thermodesulfovibrionales bacterium]|nr:glycine zipper domain-containing protein [Thermodesulfovibrionales bacterium]